MNELLTSFATAYPILAWLIATYVGGVLIAGMLLTLLVVAKSERGIISRRQMALVAFFAIIWPLLVFDWLTGG